MLRTHKSDEFISYFQANTNKILTLAAWILFGSKLGGGHPQLAAIDVIPRANEDVSLVF